MPHAVLTCSAEALRGYAHRLTRPADPDHHWSVLASILGRVKAEGHYEAWGFASARAWAVDELGCSHAEYLELAEHLWPLLQSHRARIPLERWLDMPKSRALTLLQILKHTDRMHADHWVTTALRVSTAELRDQLQDLRVVEGAAGIEPWEEIRVRMPKSTKALLEGAFAALLPEVVGPCEDLGRAWDPDVTHQLVELLAANFLAGVAR